MREPDYLSTAQVAKLLRISRQTLYNWLNEGKVSEPARHPLTKRLQWKAEDVQRIHLQRAAGEGEDE